MRIKKKQVREAKLRRRKRSALISLAKSLNKCQDLGMHVKLRHGMLAFKEGYVLQMSNDKWSARTLNYVKFSDQADDKDDDDD